MSESGLASSLESLAAAIEKAYQACLTSQAEKPEARQSAITAVCRLLTELRAYFSFCNNSELARYCQKTEQAIQNSSRHPGHARIARSMAVVIACCQAAARGSAELERVQLGMRTAAGPSSSTLRISLSLYAILSSCSERFPEFLPVVPGPSVKPVISRSLPPDGTHSKTLLHLKQLVATGVLSNHDEKSGCQEPLLRLLCGLLAHALQSYEQHREVAHQAYYQLNNTVIQIEKVATLLDWELPAGLFVQIKECIWRFLRYRNPAQEQLIYWIVPGLQQVLRQEGPIPATNLLQALSGQLMPAATSPGRNEQDLLSCFHAETCQHLSALQAFIHSARTGVDTYRVKADVCITLYKLAANFHALAYQHYYEQADCFRLLLSICMQQQIAPSAQILGCLHQFCDSLHRIFTAVSVTAFVATALAATKTALAAVAEPSTPANAELLRLETGLAMNHGHSPVLGFDLAVDLPAGSTSPSSLQLASSIRHLLNAETDLEQAFQADHESSAAVLSVLKNLGRELHWLVHGAHDLKVYRVEALASVMLDVCELLLVEQTILLDQDWQRLLLLAHRKLDCLLNQAAAHQDVDSACDIIRHLYQQLDARHFQPALMATTAPTDPLCATIDTALTPGQLLEKRCLSLPASTLQQLQQPIDQTGDAAQKILALLRAGNCEPEHQAALLVQLKRQQRCIRMLQASLTGMLKDSLAGLCQRLQRQCRQLGNAHDKQVQLLWNKTPLLLPRTLLDYLQPSLEQLVHNAVCHGLEPIAQRRQGNKPDTGSIHVQLSLHKTELVVAVEDDGAGLEQALLQAAIQRPDCGLGTIQRTMAALGGRLQCQSTLHKGSCFTLHLPRMLLG